MRTARETGASAPKAASRNPSAVPVMLRRSRDRVPVGLLHFGSDGRRQYSLFRYAPSWLESGDAFPLAPDLPLEDRDFRYSEHGRTVRTALPGPVFDGAPDSWGRAIIRAVHGAGLGERDFLLATGDGTRQGALGYLDGTPPFAGPLARSRRELGALRDLVDAWEQDRAAGTRTAEALAASIGSLGGSRPKVDFDDGGHLAIAKFTSVRDRRPVARLEVATLDLARLAGLDAARARLELRHDERPVAIVRRFDRRDGAPVPYLSARSFLGAACPRDTRIESGQAGGGDACYTDIAERLAAHGFEPERQMAELWRRLLFTILVSNTDDHLQNHGLLHVSGGRWALAPAFDIVPQPERRRRLKTGIAPEYGKAASVEAALDAAPRFGLDRDRARSMLRAMLEITGGQWAAHCRAQGMAAQSIAACRPAFEHEETAAARRLAAPGARSGPIPPGKGKENGR